MSKQIVLERTILNVTKSADRWVAGYAACEVLRQREEAKRG